MSLVVVGSVAYDGVETPHGKVDRMLGGAATYISLAAAYFTCVKLVAVVGDDFAPEDAALLIRADRVWRTVQGLLRVTYGRNPSDALSPAAAAALLRAAVAAGADAVDLPGLRATLDALARDVRAAFIRLVGELEP